MVLKKRLIMTLILVMFNLLLMTFIQGCRSIKLYPLDGDHIINVEAGEEITVPRNGYFLSDEYFLKILKAEVTKF